MRPLLALTVANIRSYVRDRAALFWTLAFPLIFIFMFGFIFQDGTQSRLDLGWADEDKSPAAGQLREAFAGQEGTELTDASKDDALAKMRQGDVDGVIVVPAGYGAGVPGAASERGGRVRRRCPGRGLRERWPDLDPGLHRPLAIQPRRVRLPVGTGRARCREPGRP